MITGQLKNKIDAIWDTFFAAVVVFSVVFMLVKQIDDLAAISNFIIFTFNLFYKLLFNSERRHNNY